MPKFDDPEAEIRWRFQNHPPTDPEIAGRLDEMTAVLTELALDLHDALPESREKSLALTKLEECSMWTKACIAREQTACIERWHQ